MKKMKTALLVAGAALGGMVIGNLAPAQAQLGDILKGGAIIVVVDRLAPQINQLVNTVTGNKTESVRETTKVVPILSIGKGTYAGAVQVSGPKNLVDRVKAVAQVEGSNKIAGTEIRVRGLIPVSARSVTDIGSISRVKGVGISAIIDARL
jgi:hypothetical protein